MSKKSKQKLPSTARGRKRLLKLADLLMENAKNRKGAKFSYTDFGSVEVPEGGLGDKFKLNCGTTGCALGLAAMSGKFKGLGAQLPKWGKNTTPGKEVSIDITLDGNIINPFKAGEKVFDLTEAEAEYLFAHISVPTDVGAEAERAVAKEIRRFVKGKSDFPGEDSMW